MSSHFKQFLNVPDDINDFAPGDVFQIMTTTDEKPAWEYALVQATEIHPWGIKAFIHQIESDTVSSAVMVRLIWQQIVYIGSAVCPVHEPGQDAG